MELANKYYKDYDDIALYQYILDGNCSLETVKILLTKKDIVPIVDDVSIVAQNGETEIVEELLKWKDSDGKCIDPSENNNFILNMASRNGHVGVVKILLKDSRVNSGNKIPALKIAFRKYQEDVIQELLKDPKLQEYVDEKKRKLELKTIKLNKFL